MTLLDSLYEDIDIWTQRYHDAHPDDTRDDLDIWMDATVYHADSPYWPVRCEHCFRVLTSAEQAAMDPTLYTNCDACQTSQF